MGLDMYLFGRKYKYTDWTNPSKNETEDGFRLCEKKLELGYWRKHPNLHGFIVGAFAGGKDECQQIKLYVKDLVAIIEAVRNEKLPHTEGFFFGESNLSLDQRIKDVRVLEKAAEWLRWQDANEIRTVYYHASW